MLFQHFFLVILLVYFEGFEIFRFRYFSTNESIVVLEVFELELTSTSLNIRFGRIKAKVEQYLPIWSDIPKFTIGKQSLVNKALPSGV